LGEVFIGADHPAEALARQVTCCPGPSGLAIASRLSAMADAIAHAAPGSSRLTAPGTFPTETAVALCGYLDDAKAPPIFHSVSATRDGFIGVVSVARASP
jgi:hypothetical protein